MGPAYPPKELNPPSRELDYGMAANNYHFVTRWSFEGTAVEVSDILADIEHLTEWWPAVYLSATVLAPGDERDIGKVVLLETRGWLPYTLHWVLKVTDSKRPHGFSIEAFGDFVGHGVWMIEEVGDRVLVVYDWRVRAEKPLLRSMSALLGPIFAANHRWAMMQGYRSMKLELLRRRARSPIEREEIPEPPPPAYYSRPLLIGLAVGLYVGMKLSRKKKRG